MKKKFTHLIISIIFISQFNCRSFEMHISSDFFNIRYTAYSANPSINVILNIDKKGIATLFLGSYFSIPTKNADALGYFKTNISSEILSNVNLLIEKIKYRDNPQKVYPLPGVIRSLSCQRNNENINLNIFDSPEDKNLVKLEKLFLEIIEIVSLYPDQAVKSELSVKEQNNKIFPTLILKNLGKKNIKTIFLDNKIAKIDFKIVLEKRKDFGSGREHWEHLKTFDILENEFKALLKRSNIKNIINFLSKQKVSISLPAIENSYLNNTVRIYCVFNLILVESNLTKIKLNIKTEPVILNTINKQQNKPLRIFISSDKKKYNLNEKIFVNVFLENISSLPVIINGRLVVNHSFAPEPYRDLYFEIKGPQGYENRRIFHINVGDIKEDSIVLIKKGDKHNRKIELTDYYSFQEKGVYKIIANYFNNSEIPGFLLWQGNLKSEPFTIVIN